MNDKNQIEPKPENDVISIAVMQVTTVFLLTTIIMKVFSLLKVLPSIGAFTAVTYSILASTAHFSLFFGAWLNLFMVLFMICGVRIEHPTDEEGRNFYATHSRLEIIQQYLLKLKI